MLHTLLFIAFAICTSWTNAQDTQHDDFALTAINSATRNSSSFALVNSTACDDSVTSKIYEIYSKNAMVFQTCVVQGQFGIFPFSGAYPTSKQLGDMGRSLACRAIFLAIVLAGIPECNFSGYPLRAAAETELKISLDMDKYPMALNVIPSTDRFVHLMMWRRNVNLASAAGLPCDSNSKLYSEFAGNLYSLTTNGLFRLTAEMKIEYRPTVDGSFSQDEIALPPQVPGQSGSGSAPGIIFVGGESPIFSSAPGSGDTSFTKRQRTAADIPARPASISGTTRLICWGKFDMLVIASVVAILAVAKV